MLVVALLHEERPVAVDFADAMRMASSRARTRRDTVRCQSVREAIGDTDARVGADQLTQPSSRGVEPFDVQLQQRGERGVRAGLAGGGDDGRRADRRASSAR